MVSELHLNKTETIFLKAHHLMAKRSQTLNSHFLLRMAFQTPPHCLPHHLPPLSDPAPSIVGIRYAVWDAERSKEEFGAEVGENEAPGFLGLKMFWRREAKKMYLEPGTPNFPD